MWFMVKTSPVNCDAPYCIQPVTHIVLDTNEASDVTVVVHTFCTEHAPEDVDHCCPIHDEDDG